MWLWASAVGTLSAMGLSFLTVRQQQRRTAEQRRLALETSRRVAEGKLQQLATTVVMDVLSSDETLDLVGRLLVKACVQPEVKQEFGSFLGDQFFGVNAPSLPALQKWLVKDLIQDEWVTECLLGLVKSLGHDIAAEPKIWPGATAEMFKVTALDALAKEEFATAVQEALKQSARRMPFPISRAA